MKVISIAVGIVIRDNKILLLQRKNEPYVGKWSFPGGKIELDEHVGAAAKREILEETGITTAFAGHIGVVSEIIQEQGNPLFNFLIHVCKLIPESTAYISTHEGDVAWFSLDEIDSIDIIPSDALMIKEMILSQGKSYYECKVEKQGDTYFLKKFD